MTDRTTAEIDDAVAGTGLWPIVHPLVAQIDTYVRHLEDAVLALWAEMGVSETILLATDSPRLDQFLRHLHHSIEHEQAMVRVNVWAEP